MPTGSPERACSWWDTWRGAIGTGGAGVAVAFDAPFALVAVLSAAAMCGITLNRATQGALLPDLVTTPAELTAANATNSSSRDVDPRRVPR